MYDVKSSDSINFIDHNEIMETLEWAEKNKNNEKLIDVIIQKAKKRKD